MSKIVVLSGIILFVVVALTFAITWVWSWVIPDVFIGAVEQGVLPASITFSQALKLSVLLTVLGVTRSSSK